jgi:hypothetical protein
MAKYKKPRNPSAVFGTKTDMDYIKINAYEMKWDKMFVDIVDAVGKSAEDTAEISVGEQDQGIIQSFWGKMGEVITQTKEYVKKGDFINTLNNSDYMDSIFLPIPNVLREVHHQMYEDSAYNMEDRFLRNGVKMIQEGVKSLGDKGNAISDVMGETVEIFDHIARRANLSADPNNLLVYSGSAPRTYTFSFNIVPQNKKEAEYYSDAVKWLKFHSLGKREKLMDPFNLLPLNTLRQSSLFTFEFYSKSLDNHHINTLFACDNTITKGFSLTNITSTLGDDALLVYNDGSPKSITLSLTFTERKPLWYSELKEFYENKLESKYKTKL